MDFQSIVVQSDHAFLSAVARELGARAVQAEGDAAWVASTSRLHGQYKGRDMNLDSAELMVLRRTPTGWEC